MSFKRFKKGRRGVKINKNDVTFVEFNDEDIKENLIKEICDFFDFCNETDCSSFDGIFSEYPNKIQEKN